MLCFKKKKLSFLKINSTLKKKLLFLKINSAFKKKIKGEKFYFKKNI